MNYPLRRDRLRRVVHMALLVMCLAPTLALAQTSPVGLEDGVQPVFGGLPGDPREVSTYLSVVDWDASWLNTRVAAIGVGDRFTIARGFKGPVELELAADLVVHAQFDLDAPSFDFINADFIVSLPLRARLGAWSGRARMGHWSAHLGDEFLLRSGVERQETSVEFVELVLARDIAFARFLVGGKRRLRIVPRWMPRNVQRVGVDLRRRRTLDLGRLGVGQLTAATDLRWDEDSAAAFSLRAGLDITSRRAGPGNRSLSIQFEFFDGPSPFGQFFDKTLRTVGVGFRFR